MRKKTTAQPTTADVFISFGGNKDDTRQYIAAAITRLGKLGAVEKISPIFETQPEGFKDQPNFLNGALLLKTPLPPEKLLRELKKIERELGRTPTFPNGPREIDLDIIFYNDIILKNADLQIPHPRMSERIFVLLPMSHIAPDFKHPATGKTIIQMLKKFA